METAIVGIADHSGWAMAVTTTTDGRVLDRRRLTLVDADLPCMPHHHDALKLPLPEGVALVERVQASAERNALSELKALAKALDCKITGIALRRLQPLPPTIAERLADYRAQNTADWVMYRQALAKAAQSLKWAVYWYDAKTVESEATKVLGVASLEALNKQAKATHGTPWDKDCRVGMAAGVVGASTCLC